MAHDDEARPAGARIPIRDRRAPALPLHEERSAVLLIVDDDPASRNLFVEQFSALGHLVFEADSGPKALQLLEDHAIDCVILDVRMPVMDGFEVLHAIRLRWSIADLPVVMTTAGETRAEIVRALACGANDYLPKPTDFEIAAARLQTHLVLKRSTDQIRRLNRQLQQAQSRIGRLTHSANEALHDIHAWAASIADELTPMIGAAALSVWKVDKSEISPLSNVTADPPSPAELIIASERKLLIRGDESIIPVHGITGELVGALVVSGKIRWDETERALVGSFSQQLGGALQVHRMRDELVETRQRLRLRRQEMIDQGIELCRLCSQCQRCYSDGDTVCSVDGSALTDPPHILPRVLSERYRLRRVIGQGGIDYLYEATDTRLERDVAVKIIKPEHFHDTAMRLRFMREARAVARIDHEGVVSLFDSGELHDGALFLVMELLRGLSLASMIRLHGPGSPRQVASLLRQAGSALAAAHRAGFVHRDIKPANVFLVDEPTRYRVKLLDFGIAKQMEGDPSLTQSGNFVGTPAYMSPEQIAGGEVGFASDLYSLAAVMYEALTARRVTLERTVSRIFYDVMQNHPPPISQLLPGGSARLDHAFRRALAKSPVDRPSDIEGWIDETAGLLETMVDVAGRHWPRPRPIEPLLRPSELGTVESRRPARPGEP